MRKKLSKKHQKSGDAQKRNNHELDTLTDWVDEQEVTKETLRSGLLRFLDYVEKVENEKLHRKG